MDDRQRASSNVGAAAIEDAVGSLRKALQAILTVQGVPTLDVEWLLLRCDDTLAYAGDVRWSSL